jgi:hypothetical protein
MDNYRSDVDCMLRRTWSIYSRRLASHAIWVGLTDVNGLVRPGDPKGVRRQEIASRTARRRIPDSSAQLRVRRTVIRCRWWCVRQRPDSCWSTCWQIHGPRCDEHLPSTEWYVREEPDDRHRSNRWEDPQRHTFAWIQTDTDRHLDPKLSPNVWKLWWRWSSTSSTSGSLSQEELDSTVSRAWCTYMY